MSENFDSLIKSILNCQNCEKEFGFLPHPVVFGNKNAKIMQISQAPSKNVHETLKPFTDQSGKKLKYEWYQITDEDFYNPDNFYITALSHCYPGKDKNGNDKKPPLVCYEKWIKQEIMQLNNQIYIIIGARAAKIFFPKENFDDLVFKNNVLNGKLAIVLPHPSPLNFRWLKNHPQFLNERLMEIRKIINDTLCKK